MKELLGKINKIRINDPRRFIASIYLGLASASFLTGSILNKMVESNNLDLTHQLLTGSILGVAVFSLLRSGHHLAKRIKNK